MQTIKKLLAVFLEVLFMGSAALALFLFNLEWRAFSPETYRQAFANGNFYDRLPLMLAEALAANTTGQSGLPFTIRGLSVHQWDAYVRAILPPDVLKAMGDEALNSIFAYLDQQSDTANVSLVPLKASMGSAKTGWVFSEVPILTVWAWEALWPQVANNNSVNDITRNHLFLIFPSSLF